VLLPIAGCGHPGPPVAFDDFVVQDARILFVGAHPDDETLAGPLLAYACEHNGGTCEIALFTRGEGSACQTVPACQNPDQLGAVRTAEAQTAAMGYGAGLVVGTFPNASTDTLAAVPDPLAFTQGAWAPGDPVAFIAGVIADFSPDLILTLDPDHGFTGHVEHEAASRYAAQAIASQPRTISQIDVLNHYDAFADFIGLDPGVVTESWDLERSCGDETCLAATQRIAAAHVSQQMSVLSLLDVGIAADLIHYSFLGQVTPLRTQPLPPK
jgi:LmbE family N-acetylglucosaminyl deacetylase